jgi:hypothetical protein
MVTARDKNLLGELAKQVRDIASEDVNGERVRRIRDMHSLKPVRPPVWIDEIPWHEMDIEGALIPQCETQEGRDMEQHFRRILYRWKYLQADMVVEDVYYVQKTFTDSGIGIQISDETVSTDSANHIVSHHYKDLLDEEEKVEALKLPVIEARPDGDQKNLETAGETLDGIMSVKLQGHGIYYAPWDLISRYRGVENCYMDMATRPEPWAFWTLTFHRSTVPRLIRMNRRPAITVAARFVSRIYGFGEWRNCLHQYRPQCMMNLIFSICAP